MTVLIQAFQIILLFRLSSDTLSRWVGAFFLLLGVILFAYKRGLSELQRGQTAPRLTGPLTDGALQYVGWSVVKPTWEESTVFLLHFEKGKVLLPFPSTLFPSSHLSLAPPLPLLLQYSAFWCRKKKKEKRSTLISESGLFFFFFFFLCTNYARLFVGMPNIRSC